MAPIMILSAWVLASLLIGLAGRDRALGFWGFFLVSLLVSPIVVGAALLLTAAVAPRRP